MKFYAENNCTHQPASAYRRHHQVAAERDIQTIVQNVAAAVHTNDFIRVSSWNQAVMHWTELHGHTPLSETGLSPNQLLYQGSPSAHHKKWTVDLNKYFRFAFGDILVFPLEKGIEYKKFSLKNDVGFYMGDDTSDSVYVYRAYYHDIQSRPGAARVDVSDVKMLRWLHKRADVRKPTLHFSEFQDAFLELAPHYYHYEGDRIDHPAGVNRYVVAVDNLTNLGGPLVLFELFLD